MFCLGCYFSIEACDSYGACCNNHYGFLKCNNISYKTYHTQPNQNYSPACSVAALVTIVSQILKAVAYDVSVQLSVYVGLIITNCILMGRLEAFAMINKPIPSFIDGLSNGLGYAMILVIVGAVREFLGRGSLLGIQIIPDSFYDAGYINNGMMTMPAMALILLGCVIWIHRAFFSEKD